MINASESIKDTMTDGKLPTHAWPGGYPMFYLDNGGCVLCPTCAQANDEFDQPITAVDVNWEDQGMYCDQCSKQIESAYEGE